jgi:tRNA (guanine10-N2)-dimethyltransferase
MEVTIVLSREHPTLPQAEVEAVLQAEKLKYNVQKNLNGLLILHLSQNFLKILPTIALRLSFTHEILQVLFQTPEKHLIKLSKQYKWIDIVKADYAVRVKKLDRTSIYNTSELEREIGEIIKINVGEKSIVNLDDPSILIRIILFNKNALVGHRIATISKKHFFKSKPHKRPFFYPGSMSPKLARCMVNLTRIKRGDTLLDPFCGTGGILIEAGIIGARVIGTDIDPKMVNGTGINLKTSLISNFQVYRSDVRSLKLPFKVDAIVTDPPYGISASTGGEKSNELYQQSIDSMQNLIKKGGLVCIATPHYLDIQKMLQGTNFQIIEQHHIRMHKSLTRVISLLKNDSSHHR